MESMRTFKKQMKASMLLAIFWICYAGEDNYLVGSSATPRTDTFIFVVSCFHPFHLSLLLWQWQSFQFKFNRVPATYSSIQRYYGQLFKKDDKFLIVTFHLFWGLFWMRWASLYPQGRPQSIPEPRDWSWKLYCCLIPQTIGQSDTPSWIFRM